MASFQRLRGCSRQNPRPAHVACGHAAEQLSASQCSTAEPSATHFMCALPFARAHTYAHSRDYKKGARLLSLTTHSALRKVGPGVRRGWCGPWRALCYPQLAQ